MLGLIYFGVLLNIGSTTVVLYHQTVPGPGIASCPGDRLVLECTTNAGTEPATALWKINDDATAIQLRNESRNHVQSNYTFNVTKIEATMDGNIMTSNATTDEPVDGTIVRCAGADFMLISLRINVSDPPLLPVNDATIEPINNSTIFINWTVQEQHIGHYNVTINSNNTHNECRTTNNTNITINDLIIGTNYSFIIIPINNCGEGPSSLIQYIWNVPAQVVNISWDQLSTDSITIWWNNTEDYIPVPPIQYYIISVYNTSNSIIYTNNTNDTNITITGLPLTDTNYTVTIIPVNVIGYGPSATVNVDNTVTSSSSILSSVTKTGLSSYTNPPILTTSNLNTPPIATASSANVVPIISGAIGTVFVIIIIIIIALIIILVYAKRHRIKSKESHTAHGNGNESKGVIGSSYRNNNIELQPTDPTYATPTTEYTPAAASTVRTLQGGDGPPSYPPPPPTTGQYSVLRASDDDDDTPPPVPAYNPNGVQEYSELRREGEKKNKQQQQQGAGPLYSTLKQDDDTPPPVPPAYNPEGVQEYSVLKREGENKGQQGLSTGATGLYSTINKDTNNQVLVDESAHKPVYADLAIAAKGKRPQAAPTQEQPVVYASVNNKSVPPPIPPPAAPHKVLYADLSIAAGKRTPKNKPPTEERVVYAAVNGNRKSTTQELIMDRLGGLDIPPPIPPKPKP